MAEAEYVWLIEDALNQRVVADIPIVDGQYEHLLLRPGYLKGKLAMKDADDNEDVLDEGRFALYVMRDGRIEQGGLIDTLFTPKGSNDVQVACRGWFSWFDRRKIRTDRQFTQTEQFEIVETLVADAQDDIALGDGADLGFIVDYVAPSGVLRDRLSSYRWFNGAWLGTALRELAAVIDGFDFDVRYAWDGDAIAKTLLLSYPEQGTDYSGQTGFEFSRSAGFTYARNDRSNVLARSMTKDASRMAWRLREWGVGVADTRLYSDAVDEEQRLVYPMFDDDITTNVLEQDTLDEQVAGAVTQRSSPARLPSFDVDTKLDPAWSSLWTGDTFDVVFDDGINSIEGAFRITGFTMDVDADVPSVYVQEVTA